MVQKNNKYINRISSFKKILIISLISSLLSPHLVLAGTLRLSPSSGSHNVGSTFSVDLVMDSTQPANTAGATLSFDPGIIRVTNVSDGNSLFSMWPEDPEYSNSAGTISFGGGMPGDSFTGTGGNIISITFRAQSEGTAEVSFDSGQLIAAGSDVTDSLQGGSYTFTDTTPEPDPEPTPTPTPDPTPDPDPTDDSIRALAVSSPTHPDSDSWYSNDSPEFVWDLPADIDSVRIQISREERTPSIVYDPAIESRTVEDLDDGVWHFTIQAGKDGSWGQIGRFTVRIDTTAPEPFDLRVDNEDDPTNPTPKMFFKTTDSVSGVAEYEIRLNDDLYDLIDGDDLDEYYRPSPIAPGDYYLTVAAIDYAGNKTTDSTLFSIDPLPLEVEDFPLELEDDEELRIVGETIPGGLVNIYIEDGEEEIVEQAKADGIGRFDFRKKLSRGTYRIRLQAEDERGALSLETERVTIEVSPDRLVMILSIVLAALILIGIFIIIFLRRQIDEEKRKKEEEQNKDTIEVKREAYNVLEERIKKQVEYLENKVDLSRSESKLLKDLQESLKVSQEARAEDDEEENDN